MNLVVFDLQRVTSAELARHAGALFDCLDQLDHGEDIEARFAFDRILVLLPTYSSAAIDELVLKLGARGVRAACRLDGALSDEPLRTTLMVAVRALLWARRKGRRALSASGGGITGIYFELGALKWQIGSSIGFGSQTQQDVGAGRAAVAAVVWTWTTPQEDGWGTGGAVSAALANF